MATLALTADFKSMLPTETTSKTFFSSLPSLAQALKSFCRLFVRRPHPNQPDAGGFRPVAAPEHRLRYFYRPTRVRS
jgi:hypothetical protein